MLKYSREKEIASKTGIRIEKRRQFDNHPLHTHDFFELSYMMDGNAVHVVNGKQYEIQKGDICIVFPTDFHEIYVIEPYTSLYISFTEEAVSPVLLYELIKKRSCGAYHLEEQEQKRFELLFELLVSTDKNSQWAELEENNLFACIITAILRKINILPMESGISKSICKAVLYITRNFKKPIFLKDLSAETGLSKNYLSKLFNEAMGLSISSYINGIRLEYAYNMLISTNNSITQICYDAGFSSESKFSKDFKKKYGMPPSQARKAAYGKTGEKETGKAAPSSPGLV